MAKGKIELTGGVFVCVCVAGVWKGVRECVRARQTQTDAQRRTEIRVQCVRQGVQTAGSPVSHVMFRRYHKAFVYTGLEYTRHKIHFDQQILDFYGQIKNVQRYKNILNKCHGEKATRKTEKETRGSEFGTLVQHI